MKIYQCQNCNVIGIDELPSCDHSELEHVLIADTNDRARIAELEQKLGVLADAVIDWAESLRTNSVLVYGEDPSSDKFVDESLALAREVKG